MNGNSLCQNTRYVCASCRARLTAPSQGLRVIPFRRIHQTTLRKRAEAEELWEIKAEAQRKGKIPTMLRLLEDRGFVDKIAGDREVIEDLMRRERLGVYVGIDPTTPSMHVGHLIPFMALFHMYANGYQAFTLLGGATAAVGDPTSRTSARKCNNVTRKQNITTMHIQMKRIWANVHSHLLRRNTKFDVGSKRGLVNNNNWLNKLPISTFLRMLGQNTDLNDMLGSTMMRKATERGDPLNYAEFSYPLLQGWDWWQMYKSLNVKMQIGGSDQLDNINAGKKAVLDIAKVDQFESSIDDISNVMPVGFTTPLLRDRSGDVLGERNGNAVWLDPEITSLHDQFEYFLQTDDADLEKSFRLFTFLSPEEIKVVLDEHTQNPGKRLGATKLAQEVCLAVHGELLTRRVMVEHGILKDEKVINSIQQQHDPNLVQWEKKNEHGRPIRINPSINKSAPQTNSASGFQHGIVLPQRRIKESTFPALLFWASLVASRSEGNLVIRSGGAYVGAKTGKSSMSDELSYVKIKTGLQNGKPWDYVIDNRLLVLRVGKWRTKIITIVSDQEWSEAIQRAGGTDKAKQYSLRNVQILERAGVGAEAGTKGGEKEARAEAIPKHMDPALWRDLDQRMQADDERWELETGERRRARNEERRMQKELNQQLMLRNHAFALNPQRKDGRRVAHPEAGAKATLVRDWDKSLVR